MNESMFDPQIIKQDFPILQKQVHDKALVYLDSAATSQKPRQVIQAITNYYENHNANVHRGVHQLGDESTHIFHQSRQIIAKFFSASPEELIIVRNTTEAINQVAYTWGERHLKAGDVILTSELEHHSNIVPWQALIKRKNARLMYIPVSENGDLDEKFIDTFDFKASSVKLLTLSQVSNTLGTVLSLTKVLQKIKQLSPQTKFLIDGAQAAPHLPVNFDELPIDFYVVSAHKMLGPMGIGGLLVKKEILTQLAPFLLGGGMISEVSLQDTTFADDLEERFTAGTPDVAGLAGWAAACSYLSELGMENVLHHDRELVAYALEKLAQVPEVTVIGPKTAHNRVGSVAFLYQGVHAHDVGQILDSEGVAIRSGHHCTMPLHSKFNWQASIRMSFNVYNTNADIDSLISALAKVKKVFGI